MSIEAPFSNELVGAVNAKRALIKADELGGSGWNRGDQDSELIAGYASCPEFLCGDLVVINRSAITWGHQTKNMSMRGQSGVRGCLFLFLDENLIAVCLQMDGGSVNQRLYHDLGGGFIPFLRRSVFPTAFSWFNDSSGHSADPETTRVFIADERFQVLACDDPTA